MESRVAVDGRKRFRGILKGLENDTVVLETEEGAARIPLDAVQKAKLVLTDDLIRAHGGTG